MVVYAELTIPADGFRIGKAFSTLPDVRVELDRVVPTMDAVVPFIWVRGAPPADVVRATREQGAVQEISVLSTHDERTLYRVVWNRTFNDTMVSISDSELALLSGSGTAEQWHFEFRGGSKAPLSAFITELREDGIPIRVVRLAEDRPKRDDRENRLTGPQYEAVQLAYERGYFDDPRGSSLDTLADEVGVSRQAFSGRLRRAFATLTEDIVDDYVE
ncbi:hypothetical protein GJR96_14005 [Haloferax sp. MBLA0076]|uniref:Bacterio-opsin activator n=1 Tax=Haloferax litoreum TaxID=2666140 RepID=A0A6A8GI58_9EURY|nr:MULTISPECIES: helix-turn-helix domain-containing protein [Haloferax]KAB1194495.1 hypothetical protein Hfx1148_13935 [Haloferax sp. CBA1148]MRX23064.1 hypothetical protein [Haloferax litoreum]